MRSFSLPILSLSLAALLTVSGPAEQPGDLIRTFLRDAMGFSANDVAAVQAGRAVARQMKTREAVDVNIFGAVRLATSAEAFLSQLRDIDLLERRLGIIQVGKFHDPPLASDLDGLTLEKDDLDALEGCRPSNCDLQLPAEAMERFRSRVNWRADDARAQAMALFRQIAFEWLETYRAGGSASLGAYADHSPPISNASEFHLLIAPGDMPADLPGLIHYLVHYPKSTLKDAADFFYWNKGEFGMKPTTRLNHVVIYPLAGTGAPEPLRYVMATKQLYANHYFSATLELRTVVDDPQAPGRGIYLLYTTKSRVSGLTGFIGTLIRSIVKSRARSGMEQFLTLTRKAVEGR